ncbi:hypothetical protein CBR_g40051 [Chara braunii]|uniref:Phosphate transporter n=1 Tax=Chara braunii TaxID=69332 RepID=A0A388LT20_CHABU|nr:hypothetical protein CBR_g40051 [Chara braunii]|eukprot:GBG85409.1 hypothetical protein CBR_g40051 [Chara braunii]
MAVAIGANDVANSFAGAVGSKALTLRQAVVVAWIFEFAGAFFMGDRVVETVRGNIIDPELYLLRSPTEFDKHGASLLMWGMCTSLVMASAWIACATYHGMAISTTHSIACALMGFSLVVKGWGSVHWTGGGGKIGGFTSIVLSWVLTPVMAGILSASFFHITKRLLLRAEDPAKRTLAALPVYYAATAFVITFFIVCNGSGRLHLQHKSNKTATWIATSVGIGVGLLARLIGVPLARKRLERMDAEAETTRGSFSVSTSSSGGGKSKGVTAEAMAAAMARGTPFEAGAAAGAAGGGMPASATTAADGGGPLADAAERGQRRWGDPPVVPFGAQRAGEVGQAAEGRAWEWLENWYSAVEAKTIAHDLEFTERTKTLHAHAEVFDDRAEELFCLLQILTACAFAFAHGTNDTANAIGPLSSIQNIYDGVAVHRSIANIDILEVNKVGVKSWMMAMAGSALGLGFAVWGWRMVRSLGGGLTLMTPSRGFTTVLSAALTITVASFLAMPISTTHTLVGSTVGVGMSDGCSNVDWKLLGKFAIAWVLTVLVAGAGTALFFALTVYSPNIRA